MTQLLLIDDDDATREVLSLLLEAEGWQITAAQHGDAALPIARTHQPHVILSDLHMPGTCGTELAHLLRSACGTAILLAMTATPLEAAPDGYDALLVKPFQAAAVRSLAQGVALSVTAHVQTVDTLSAGTLRLYRASMPAAQVRTLYEFALADASTRVNSMAAAEDTESFQREAHALKGSSAMFGALRLRDMAANAEVHGPSCLSMQSNDIPDFHAEIAAVRRMLGELIPSDN